MTITQITGPAISVVAAGGGDECRQKKMNSREHREIAGGSNNGRTCFCFEGPPRSEKELIDLPVDPNWHAGGAHFSRAKHVAPLVPAKTYVEEVQDGRLLSSSRENLNRDGRAVSPVS